MGCGQRRVPVLCFSLAQWCRCLTWSATCITYCQSCSTSTSWKATSKGRASRASQNSKGRSPGLLGKLGNTSGAARPKTGTGTSRFTQCIWGRTPKNRHRSSAVYLYIWAQTGVAGPKTGTETARFAQYRKRRGRRRRCEVVVVSECDSLVPLRGLALILANHSG